MRSDDEWIAGTLINDESSSDDEMTKYFQREGEMSRTEARFYVAQRWSALYDPFNFELQDYSTEGDKQ